MVICCSATGCRNSQKSLTSNGNKLSFHRFPRDKDLCDAWLIASHRYDFVPTKYSYLCSEHFIEDQFNRTQKGGTRLRPNAVPTVFPQVISRIKNRVVPRKLPLQKVTEVKTKVTTPPKQLFPVQPRVKIAPKPSFEAPPTVQIAPKLTFEDQDNNITPNQVFDEQPPITIVPHPVVGEATSLTPTPLITNLSSIADTILSSNLIQAALMAYKQSTNSNIYQQQTDGTPVSVYVVHPQPNGSNIVTINPNIPNLPSARTVPAPNAGSLPTTSAQSPTRIKRNPVRDALLNIETIKQYENRIKGYRKTIKLLQQQHLRQHNKIEKLQNTIKDMKCAGFLEIENDEAEDVSEEDMSEEEIYEELLKHQSESEKTDENGEEEEEEVEIAVSLN